MSGLPSPDSFRWTFNYSSSGGVGGGNGSSGMAVLNHSPSSGVAIRLNVLSASSAISVLSWAGPPRSLSSAGQEGHHRELGRLVCSASNGLGDSGSNSCVYKIVAARKSAYLASYSSKHFFAESLRFPRQDNARLVVHVGHTTSSSSRHLHPRTLSLSLWTPFLLGMTKGPFWPLSPFFLIQNACFCLSLSLSLSLLFPSLCSPFAYHIAIVEVSHHI